MLTPPKHIAIIMDGNGRWAKKRLMPRLAGHRAGRKAAREAVEYAARDADIEVLTLFAFSTENWARPEEEVSGLMRLFASALSEEVGTLEENGIRIRFVGDLSRFSNELQQKMQQAEQRTAQGERLCLQLALNYGGRADITQSVRQLASKVAAGELKPADISETDIAEGLYGAAVPNPDLLIRTGGERRISNFLLWDLAYAEFYFTDILWPDFDAKEMALAVDWFAKRQRRFGQTGEQVTGTATEPAND
jgi:undecaprenyl diphosphate synthase